MLDVACLYDMMGLPKFEDDILEVDDERDFLIWMGYQAGEAFNIPPAVIQVDVFRR